MAGGKKGPKSKPTTNGANTPAVVVEEPKGPPTVFGISLGGSYASIAVVNKEGHPECIANEDGERQIACAISFNGQELYIGNQAKPQLVKNAVNTITGFRNQLGKKYESPHGASTPKSAPVVAGADDIPSYTVSYIASSNNSTLLSGTASGAGTPKTKKSATATPVARSIKSTPLATPRPSSPQPETRTITASEATSMFLRSLQGSAQDFIGKDVDGAVISCPTWFDDAQRKALVKAAEDAGIKVLGLLEEPAAVFVAYEDREGSVQTGSPDRITLVVDVGASSLTVTCLSVRAGLIHPMATIWEHNLGGNSIDDLLISHFAKEFSKKTKTPLHLPATTPEDARAEAKLRLESEHTKRTLSAGGNTAQCSVESLKDGQDLHASITRMRFDMLVSPVYHAVSAKARECLQNAGIDPVLVDELILAGASSALPGLRDELLSNLLGINEDDEEQYPGGEKPLIRRPRRRILDAIEPYAVVALGAVAHARHLVSLDEDAKAGFEESSAVANVKSTQKPIGLVLQQADGSRPWIPVVYARTPLPCRRILRLDVDSAQVKIVGFELWEGEDSVEAHRGGELVDEAALAAAKAAKADEEDEEDDEEIVRTRVSKPVNCLGAIQLSLEAGIATKVIISVIVTPECAIEAKVWEEGFDANTQELKLPAP